MMQESRRTQEIPAYDHDGVPLEVGDLVYAPKRCHPRLPKGTAGCVIALGGPGCPQNATILVGPLGSGIVARGGAKHWRLMARGAS